MYKLIFSIAVLVMACGGRGDLPDYCGGEECTAESLQCAQSPYPQPSECAGICSAGRCCTYENEAWKLTYVDCQGPREDLPDYCGGEECSAATLQCASEPYPQPAECSGICYAGRCCSDEGGTWTLTFVDCAQPPSEVDAGVDAAPVDAAP